MDKEIDAVDILVAASKERPDLLAKALDAALIEIKNQVELYRFMIEGNVQKPPVYSHRNGETAMFNLLAEIVEQLRWCDYECEAGPLIDNEAFRALEQMATYSHRNGEWGMLPTEPGRYWFKGIYSKGDAGIGNLDGEVLRVSFSENMGYVHHGGDGFYLGQFETGRWWGPIMPLWNEQDTERK